MSDNLPATGNEGELACPNCHAAPGVEHDPNCPNPANICSECGQSGGFHMSACTRNPNRAKAVVDGTEAEVKPGRPLPDQPRLIRVPTDEVLRTIANKREELEAAKDAKKSASNKVKILEGQLNEILEAVEERVAEDVEAGLFDEEEQNVVDDAAPAERNVTTYEQAAEAAPDAAPADVQPPAPAQPALPPARKGAPKLEKGQSAAEWIVAWEIRMRETYGPHVREIDRGRGINWLMALARQMSPEGTDPTTLANDDLTGRTTSKKAREVAADWEDTPENWPEWAGQP